MTPLSLFFETFRVGALITCLGSEFHRWVMSWKKEPFSKDGVGETRRFVLCPKVDELELAG